MTLELSTLIGIDLGTSDKRYVALFFRFIFSMVSILFLNTCLPTMIDIKNLEWICMHLT